MCSSYRSGTPFELIHVVFPHFLHLIPFHYIPSINGIARAERGSLFHVGCRDGEASEMTGELNPGWTRKMGILGIPLF
jgi:hypothetical protein